MIRVAIVEDCEEDRCRLSRLLEQYQQETENSFLLTTYNNGESLLEQSGSYPDIVFLDIELGGINGISLAKKIRESNQDTLIVLTTNLMQYAIQGYSIQASDYILKPIQYDRLKQKMDDLIRVCQTRKKFIIFNTKTGVKKFTVSRICYIEVFGHRLFIHSKDGKEEVKGTLKTVEEELALCGFVKCNKCYLVNLEYVNSIKADMVDVNGDWLKISRREKKDFLNKLTLFVQR